MERKLASVQTVLKIEPIENADKIEMATVLGWHCVVKKDEFKVGDKVVYFEIDSILPPDNPAFDFLKNSRGRMKPLKTKKIRGVFSQGLVMPLSVLPTTEVEEGQDVTDILRVKKKEDEIIEFYKNAGTFRKSTFPPFIHKTDETRVQVLQKQLNVAQGKLFVATEKIDGTSFTAFIREGKFGICSRNMEVDMTVDSPYSAIAKKYNLEDRFNVLREFTGYDFAIQGEIIGSNIQGNKYKVDDYECYLFNFFNIDKQKDIGFFADKQEEQEFNSYTLDKVATFLRMKTVPIIDENFVMTSNIDKLVDYSVGKSVLNENQDREGIVFRLKHNREISQYGERISFKAINPYFLLK